jgi:hypothetical protein
VLFQEGQDRGFGADGEVAPARASLTFYGWSLGSQGCWGLCSVCCRRVFKSRTNIGKNQVDACDGVRVVLTFFD